MKNMSDAASYGYEQLKKLAESVGRHLNSLYVLAAINDPFVAGLPARRE